MAGGRPLERSADPGTLRSCRSRLNYSGRSLRESVARSRFRTSAKFEYERLRPTKRKRNENEKPTETKSVTARELWRSPVVTVEEFRATL